MAKYVISSKIHTFGYRGRSFQGGDVIELSDSDVEKFGSYLFVKVIEPEVKVKIEVPIVEALLVDAPVEAKVEPEWKANPKVEMPKKTRRRK